MDNYHGYDVDAVSVERIGKRGKRRVAEKKKKRPAKIPSMPGGIRQRRNKHLLW